MGDLLRMDFINGLPPPLFAYVSGSWWPIHDIDVQTGLLRMDIVGLLQAESFGSVLRVKDANGVEYDSDVFYNE